LLKICADSLESRVRCSPSLMLVSVGSGEVSSQETNNSSSNDETSNDNEVDLDAALAFTRVNTELSNMICGEAVENRRSGGPWRELWEEGAGRLERGCWLLAELSDGGGGEGGEADIHIQKGKGKEREKEEGGGRPPMALVDLLEVRSGWLLKMGPLEEKKEKKNEKDAEKEVLKASITLLSQALRIAMEQHSFIVMPETRRGGGAGWNEKENEEVFVDGEAVDVDVVHSLTLPSSRRCCSLQLSLASLHLRLARLNSEHVSSKEANESYLSSVTDPVVRWIDATAPKVDRPEDSDVLGLQSALVESTSARKMGRFCPVLAARAEGVVGECLGLMAQKRGLLDEAWEEGRASGVNSAVKVSERSERAAA